MKKINILHLLFSLLFLHLTTQVQATTADSSSILIRKVISDFQRSIVEKDSTLFYSILFDKKTSLVGIMSAPTEMSIKKNNPDFQGISVSTATRFIREICVTPKMQEEKIFNIEIKADAPLATVSFDYAFLSENKIIQWGQERWTLVYAEAQWLITQINFSIRFPEIEKCPYPLE